MKLELLDEDKELQNESDQLQMWKKDLEDQILDLKKDCLNALKEFQQFSTWRYKIEGQIDLLSKLNDQHLQSSPRCDMYLNSQPVQDDKGQKKCVDSSNKTPVKNGTSHRAFFFGSNEKSSTFEFKFCKEIPDIKFTFKNGDKSVEKSSKNKKEYATTEVEKVYIKESLCSARRRLYAKAWKTKAYKYLWLRDGSILMCRDDGAPVVQITNTIDLSVENSNGKPNGNTNSAKEEGRNEEVRDSTEGRAKEDCNEVVHKNAGGGDSANKTESEVASSTLNSDPNLMRANPSNDDNWKSRINSEMGLIKEQVLQLKKNLKESCKWKKNIENKVHELASFHHSCKTNDKTQFVKLDTKIYEHYLNIQESIIDIKLSQMPRSELICRLNDLKDIVFDRFNQLDMSISEVKRLKHGNASLVSNMETLTENFQNIEPDATTQKKKTVDLNNSDYISSNQSSLIEAEENKKDMQKCSNNEGEVCNPEIENASLTVEKPLVSNVEKNNLNEVVTSSNNVTTIEESGTVEGTVLDRSETIQLNGKENIDIVSQLKSPNLHECTECIDKAAVETNFYSLPIIPIKVSEREKGKVVLKARSRKNSLDESIKMPSPLLKLAEDDKVISKIDLRKSPLDETVKSFSPSLKPTEEDKVGSDQRLRKNSLDENSFVII